MLWPRARSGVHQLKFKNNTGIRIRACTRTAARARRGQSRPITHAPTYRPAGARGAASLLRPAPASRYTARRHPYAAMHRSRARSNGNAPPRAHTIVHEGAQAEGPTEAPGEHQAPAPDVTGRRGGGGAPAVVVRGGDERLGLGGRGAASARGHAVITRAVGSRCVRATIPSTDRHRSARVTTGYKNPSYLTCKLRFERISKA